MQREITSMHRKNIKSFSLMFSEVVLNQWLQENFESVTSMYEDRFELHVLRRELLDNPIQSQNDSVDWWKKLPFRKSAIKSSLPYVHISQFSLPLRRTKELRALTGWYKQDEVQGSTFLEKKSLICTFETILMY
ncbi:hypothetical protein Cni_G05542 [Canna indica]|uniref:Uncharacterized protein n=1 Tax=Canna indica TaxID=4628 RepID=A0AAQ3Q5K8_9LILI|nr:hypothetical protein Cni_G05542 [Canna indica]